MLAAFERRGPDLVVHLVRDAQDRPAHLAWLQASLQANTTPAGEPATVDAPVPARCP